MVQERVRFREPFDLKAGQYKEFHDLLEQACKNNPQATVIGYLVNVAGVTENVIKEWLAHPGSNLASGIKQRLINALEIAKQQDYNKIHRGLQPLQKKSQPKK
jgi:hypothetical protein